MRPLPVRKLTLAVLLALGASTATGAQSVILVDSRDSDVTEAEISAANRKVAAAYGALVTMWTADFETIGTRFVAPTAVRYRGAARTSCGFLRGDNAIYCPTRNQIFYDEAFVARQARAAARELGTDGDMVAIGIIAHEMGHAVAAQLGEASRVPYENEATADCLAGVFTQQARRDGSLEPGDLEEAEFGMAAAGDPPIQLTGDPRYDRRLTRTASAMGHGSRDQRVANFRAGYDGGAAACLEAFR